MSLFVVSKCVKSARRSSHVDVVGSEDGGLQVVKALAVQRVHMAVYAVAAVHLGHGRRGVGCGAQRLRVGERAAELDTVLIPVTP